MVSDQLLEYEVKNYKPSIFKLAPDSIRMKRNEKIRLMFRYLMGGYQVFCLVETITNKTIGYAWLKKKYLWKYPFMKKNDYIINPYYIMYEYRNRGYGKLLLKSVCTALNKHKLFAVVKTDNFPSISVLKSCGFTEIGYIKFNKIGKGKVVTETTSSILFER